MTAVPKWGRDEFVQRTLDAFARGLHAELEYRIRCDAAVCLRNGQVESPLEAAFYTAWAMYGALRNSCTGQVFVLEPQAAVAQYRVDFQVGLPATSPYVKRFPAIAVELDGHEFHERTKEQVAKRNARDRDLLRLGWTVLRYSGSEFYRDPFKCVVDAWGHADDAVGRLMLEDWRTEADHG